MEAFNLWYATGSLIAAAAAGLVIAAHLPLRNLIREHILRQRFEKTFGFPPPRGKRGPGSQPISWERREKIVSCLAISAREIDICRREKRFCLKWAFQGLATIVALESEETEEYKAGMVKEVRNLFRRSLSAYLRYLRGRRKFHRAVYLANHSGFNVHGDYPDYLPKGR